jgi:hypothetical protein
MTEIHDDIRVFHDEIISMFFRIFKMFFFSCIEVCRSFHAGSIMCGRRFRPNSTKKKIRILRQKQICRIHAVENICHEFRTIFPVRFVSGSCNADKFDIFFFRRIVEYVSENSQRIFHFFLLKKNDFLIFEFTCSKTKKREEFFLRIAVLLFVFTMIFRIEKKCSESFFFEFSSSNLRK